MLAPSASSFDRVFNQLVDIPLRDAKPNCVDNGSHKAQARPIIGYNAMNNTGAGG